MELLSGLSCVGAICVAVGRASEVIGGTRQDVNVALRSSDRGTSWELVDLPTALGVYMSAISCVSSNFCVAAGTGAELSIDGGRSWTIEDHVMAATAVSCATTTSCLATGTGSWSSVDGMTWTSTAANGFSTNPEATTCVVLDAVTKCWALGVASPGYVESTTDLGATWTTAAAPVIQWRAGGNSNGALSCSAAGSCVAVGADSVATSTDGVNWSSKDVGGGTRTWLEGVSCNAASCQVVGTTPSDSYLDRPFSITVNAATGSPMGQLGLFSANVDFVTSASCPSPSICLASGIDMSYANVLLTSLDQAHTWREARLPSSIVVIDQLDCVSTTRCMLAGENRSKLGVVLVSANRGASWTTTRIPGGLTEVVALACSASFCVASALAPHSRGVLLTSDNRGATWSIATQPKGYTSFDAVTCASSMLCFAGGAGKNSAHGAIASISPSVLHWSALKTPASMGEVLALACPTPARCYEGGATQDGISGQAWTTANTGRTWRLDLMQAGVGPLTQISCWSAGGCVAAASSTKLINFPNLAAPLMFNANQNNWFGDGGGSRAFYVAGVACARTGGCLEAFGGVGTGNGDGTNDSANEGPGIPAGAQLFYAR
jgi:hypothetical protein